MTPGSTGRTVCSTGSPCIATFTTSTTSEARDGWCWGFGRGSAAPSGSLPHAGINRKSFPPAAHYLARCHQAMHNSILASHPLPPHSHSHTGPLYPPLLRATPSMWSKPSLSLPTRSSSASSSPSTRHSTAPTTFSPPSSTSVCGVCSRGAMLGGGRVAPVTGRVLGV